MHSWNLSLGHQLSYRFRLTNRPTYEVAMEIPTFSFIFNQSQYSSIVEGCDWLEEMQNVRMIT